MVLAINPQPTPTIRGVVEQFHHDNTSFEKMSPEKAYFLEKLGLNASVFYITAGGKRRIKEMANDDLYVLYDM